MEQPEKDHVHELVVPLPRCMEGGVEVLKGSPQFQLIVMNVSCIIKTLVHKAPELLEALKRIPPSVLKQHKTYWIEITLGEQDCDRTNWLDQ
jgi:hypothetical protein